WASTALADHSRSRASCRPSGELSAVRDSMRPGVAASMLSVCVGVEDWLGTGSPLWMYKQHDYVDQVRSSGQGGERVTRCCVAVTHAQSLPQRGQQLDLR